MKQYTLLRLWIFLLIAIVIAVGVVIIQLLSGHGSVIALMGLLSVLSFASAQVFKKAVIILWMLALIFAVSAFLFAL